MGIVQVEFLREALLGDNATDGCGTLVSTGPIPMRSTLQGW
jgi:hypothetical protein